MSLWSSLLAAIYDRGMAEVEKAGLSATRERLLAGASGRVLEIGGGTGANLPFYGPGVRELVVVEPEEPMSRRLERKLAGYRIPTRVVRAPAEQLPLESASFDCAVSTLVLCSVADPARALSELRRVLKPDGRLFFIEHVRSDDRRIALWQDRLRRPWAWVAGGCQTNRRTLEAIVAAGFTLRDYRKDRLRKAHALVKPLVVGEAARGR